MSNSLRDKSIGSFVWKTGQSVCTLGMTFLIQLLLARILDPEDFGIIAITSVFLVLANTIIDTSFSSSVIQREDLDQKLLSSIFYANLLLSLAVYAVLFVIAPGIAGFYEEPVLIPILRVQGLRVLISGFYSIPQAFLNRKMKFKTLFFCSLLGSVGQAIIGFSMALAGAGVWALVISTLSASVITGIAMILVERWKPVLFFSFSMVRDALSFSSKVLAIRVVRKLYYNIRVLAMGKVYDTEILGYFNKGFQFPSTAMTVVDGSLTSVAFASLARLQNDREKLLSSLRQYVRISMFVCTPLMAGMALVAKPMVLVLLTEKWLPCVPFLQIICMNQMLIPLNVKTTAFEALGKSNISMKLHLSGIGLSLVLLAVTIPFSPLIMTAGGVVATIILQISIAVVIRRDMNYGFRQQLRDSLCGCVPTVVMCAVIVALSFLQVGNFAALVLQIFAGIVTFVVMCVLTKDVVFFQLLGILKKKLKGKK